MSKIILYQKQNIVYEYIRHDTPFIGLIQINPENDITFKMG